MSEHLEVRDLLGPYVMGVLEPEEEREVEEHLEGCRPCTEEARDLRLAHERLVDLANTTEIPPPQLKGRVIPGMPRRVSLVAAVFAVLAVLGGLLYSFGLLGQDQVASATLEPTDLARSEERRVGKG